MEPERKRLELLETKHEYDLWKRRADSAQKTADTYNEMIKKFQKTVDDSEERARENTMTAAAWAQKLAKLSSKS